MKDPGSTTNYYGSELSVRRLDIDNFRSRPPGPSIVDLLTRGGELFQQLPAASVGDHVLEGKAMPLPKIFEGEGEHLKEWADSSVASYVRTGQAQLRKKDYVSARHSFELARLVDPNTADGRVGLIQVELVVGHDNKALQMIRELGSRAPRTLSNPFDVALWHETQEAYDEFLRNFRDRMARMGTANEMVNALSGYVAWTTGDRPAAANQFKQAARLVPQEQAWMSFTRVIEAPSIATPRAAALPSATTSPITKR